jgi:hypothetical protein
MTNFAESQNTFITRLVAPVKKVFSYFNIFSNKCVREAIIAPINEELNRQSSNSQVKVINIKKEDFMNKSTRDSILIKKSEENQEEEIKSTNDASKRATSRRTSNMSIKSRRTLTEAEYEYSQCLSKSKEVSTTISNPLRESFLKRRDQEKERKLKEKESLNDSTINETNSKIVDLPIKHNHTFDFNSFKQSFSRENTDPNNSVINIRNEIEARFENNPTTTNAFSKLSKSFSDGCQNDSGFISKLFNSVKHSKESKGFPINENIENANKTTFNPFFGPSGNLTQDKKPAIIDELFFKKSS